MQFPQIYEVLYTEACCEEANQNRQVDGRQRLIPSFWRARLDKMVSGLQAGGIASTPYQDRDW